MKRSAVSKDHWGYIFIAPFVIIFIGFVFYPIANTFYLAFTDTRLISPGWRGDFVGLDNFRMLYNSTMFRRAVTNTWLLWLGNFIPQMFLALTLAAMFSSTTFKLKGAGFFKAIYYLPNLMMPVTIAALFSFFLSIHGPFNQFLVGTTGLLSEPRNFMVHVRDIRVTVMFIQTWLWFGQTAIVLVAGMMSISPDYYESAMIDGASQVKMFFFITLPLIKPIMLFVLVTSLMGGLQMFDIPQLLTGTIGGQGNAALTVNMFMNNQRTFPAGMLGYAAAVSVVLFFMSGAVALVLFRLFRSSTEAQDAKKAARRIAKMQAEKKNAVGGETA